MRRLPAFVMLMSSFSSSLRLGTITTSPVKRRIWVSRRSMRTTFPVSEPYWIRSPVTKGFFTASSTPEIRLAAMSWKAKPRARPMIPTPASNEVTVWSRCSTPSAAKRPPTITPTRASAPARPGSWVSGPSPREWRPRVTQRPTQRAANHATTTRTRATTMLGNMSTAVSPQLRSFSKTSSTMVSRAMD